MSDEGELIAGRYRLVSRVGHGGMGVVWRAHDERLDRVVAVKELSLDPTADDAAADRAMRRARREGRVAARLRHPHAITVHDVVTHRGVPCLVMEFLPSRSLSALLDERGTLAPAQVAEIGAQLASALAAAHREGIVHRDVKPGNVLVTDDGLAKLADFGISRAAGEGTVTGANVIAGTPAYLAPEVANGGEAASPADVFSLGATLYAALEGTPPFGASGNPIALLVRIAQDDPVPPRHAGPLREVVLAMLRREPAARPTMRQVHDALTDVAAGRAVEVPAPRDPTLLLASPPWPRLSRRTAVTGVLAVALVAVGFVIGAALTRGGVGEEAGNTGTVGGTGTAGYAADAPTTGNPEVTSGTTTSTPGASPTSEAGGRAGCTAGYRVTNTWPGGYQAEVTVRAVGETATSGWSVRWALPSGHVVEDLWNGIVSRDGSTMTVRATRWNAVVEPGRTTAFGFVARLTDPENTVAPDTVPTLTCE